MNPMLLALLTLAVLGGLPGYALHRAATADVPAVLTTAARTLPALALSAVVLVLIDPSDVPSVLRAVLPR
ncbi:hypothetical protein [Streptomyces sp. NPDC048357]|uniref:hypothetical protein n=1 Tax=Streptomyces sp. NPDC048357 TaxID=3154719 RepID=UPI00343F386F